MEMAKFTTKSLLKKTGSTEINKSKKVTFNNTVKLFIDDRSKNSKINSDSELKIIEIGIVDKSSDCFKTDSQEDCKADDFLVHKVIYDNYVLPENDEDLDFKHDVVEDQTVVFEPSHEDEGLDFVVHKVTEHEDDLIEKDSDFVLENGDQSKDEPTLDQETNSTATTFSKLSIENILEHDKIIAFIDQRNLGLNNTPITNSNFLENNDLFSNNSTEKLANSLVLSPPLQELSLEKIVKAHSNNILCELDISPLNSVQETDSDSDLSSEGTMIMMTTEECQKNEQHIRESLLQYQSMREKAKEVESQSVASSSEDVKCEAVDGEVSEKIVAEQETHDSPTEDGYTNGISTHEESSPALLPNELPFQRTYSSSAETVLSKDDYQSNTIDNQTMKFQNALARVPSESSSYITELYMTSVKIPSDVREWKIVSNSSNKSPPESLGNEEFSDRLSKEHLDIHNRLSEEYYNEYTSNFTHNELNEHTNIPNGGFEKDPVVEMRNPHYHQNGFSPHPPKADELESFVHESNERVERIRKRYHVSGRHHQRPGITKQSPVRGIRPRFGSTAEILQLMQKQNNPPFISFSGSKNHMSWPCEETVSSPEFSRTKHHYYESQSLSSHSSMDSFGDDQSNTSCDHFSISSCPSVMMHERGAPEGASPPNSVLGNEDSCTSDNPNGFVYFSMKV